jgi:hypothetical protein
MRLVADNFRMRPTPSGEDTSVNAGRLIVVYRVAWFSSELALRVPNRYPYY